MMRVLHCIPSMLGGGAERQLSYLAGEMPSLGWEVHVALGQGGPNLPRLERSGATIHRLPSHGNHDPRLLLNMVRIIRTVKPDVVHAWLLQMEVVAGLAALATRTPWIIAERSAGPPGALPAKHRVRMLLASHASAIIANSDGGDRFWAARVPRRVARYVVHNGLPLDEIAAAAPLSAGETGGRACATTPLLLYVGRLDPEKNIEALLATLPRVAARVPLSAVLCGDGPLRGWVEHEVQQQRMESYVRVAGFVENSWGWMKRANVLVSLSPSEGCPNAVLEAMACGTPLVLSDIPAHRALVDDGAAWLVDPAQPSRVADAIAAVLASPAEAAVRAQRARARIEAFGIRRVAERHGQIYAEVLRARARAAIQVSS